MPMLKLVERIPHPAFEPGRTDRRFFAMIIDTMVLTLLLSPISLLNNSVQAIYAASHRGGSGHLNVTSFIIMGLSMLLGMGAQLLAVFFYYGWFYRHKGGSPGKLMLGIRVVDAQSGTYLGYGRAFLRETLGKAISMATLLGYVLVFFRSDRRALHDLLSDSQTLYERPA